MACVKRLRQVRTVAVTLTALRRLDGDRKPRSCVSCSRARLLEETPLVFLEDANLGGADLAGADLEFANLVGADLEGAGLGRANLRGAILRGANLRGAILLGAHFEGAYLERADLEGALLERGILRGADLGGADLAGATLRAAYLEFAELEGANLERAILTGAHLGGADLAFTRGLDRGRFIAYLPPGRQKAFLDSQKEFLDSLSREELSKFNLSPEKLARLRREAGGP